MTDQAQNRTPGEVIRQARQSRDLTLETLSARTKIPPPVLDALERDEYHKVSGPLYIKSFLRTCAGELGLDADELLDLYGRFSGEVKGAPGEVVWEEEAVQITRVGLPWARLVLVAVAAAALLTVGVLALRGCGGDGQEPAAHASMAPAQGELPSGETTAAMDTLAGAFLDAAATAPDEGAAEAQPEEAPESDEPADAGPAAESGAQGANATPPRPRNGLSDLPAAVPADSLLAFQSGRRWRVVMRLVTREPVIVQVGRDDESGYRRAIWPAEGQQAPALPATGIQPGLAYAVREGMAVYWGAADHFRLRLDRTDGVAVSFNGVRWDISSLGPGEELVLDRFGARDQGGR